MTSPNKKADRPLNELHPDCQNFLDTHNQFEANDVLLGYQKRWIQDDSQLKIAEKSRRTGLTWAEAADNALTASLKKSDGGSDVFYIGSSKEMAREYIDAVAMWAKMFNYAVGEIQEQEEVFETEDGKNEILSFVIYFASGYKVKALSSNPKNLRGMQGTVVIDEAAFHEYLAEVLKAALALTMWGAKVRLISTHNGVDNLFNELITDSRAGKKRYSVHTVTLDDACREGLYKRICQVTKQEWSQEKEDQWKADLLKDTANPEDALEEYQCIPKKGGGSWLTRAVIEKNMSKDTPIIELVKKDEFTLLPEHERRKEINDWLEENVQPLIDKLDPKLKHYAGEDFARNKNLTSISVGAEQPNLDLEVQFIIELGKMPYKQQEQIVVDFLLQNLPNFSGAAFDARGNGGFLAEAAADEFGYWDEETQTGLIILVQFSDKWYRENTAPFKSALEDGTFNKIPKRDSVLADLRSFKKIKGIPKIPATTTKEDADGIKRHADSAISLLLLRHAQFNIFVVGVEIGLATEETSHQTTYQAQGMDYEGVFGAEGITVGMTRGY